MKYYFSILPAEFIIILMCACLPALSGCGKNPDVGEVSVIIDSDMSDSVDDGIAFMMLTGTDNIHIDALITETTNVWAQEALAYGIRLGELCGGKDIAYIAGEQYALRSGRFDALNPEIDMSPGTESNWRGAVSYPEVKDWETFYIGKYLRKPEIKPVLTDAAQYIYQTVMSNPGKITILALGKCTNIAKALLAHPEMASNTKEIIYMGGAVHCPGNTTTYAEMNFLYDPESAAICLRAPFPKQTIVSLDVCNTVTVNRDRYLSLCNSVKSEDIKKILQSNYFYMEFEKNPNSEQLIWDLISAAITIDPGIIAKYEQVKLDVDDNPNSPTYGKSFVSKNESRQTVRLPMAIDEERFWTIVHSGLSNH